MAMETYPDHLAINGAVLGVIQLITTEKLAKAFNVKPQTVRLWRVQGKGPRYIRLSASKVAYDPRDVEQWIRDRAFSSTAEEAVR